MPPKTQPKFYQLLLKTHTLTIFLTVAPTATIASVKQEAYAALTSDVNQVEDVPLVTSQDDFEICKAKPRRTGREYEVLDESLVVKSSLSNWEHLFIQFRDDSGELMPVEYTQPSLQYDEEEESRTTSTPASESPTGKGKRKAPDT